MKNINRFQEIPHEGPMCDYLWSDPEDIEEKEIPEEKLKRLLDKEFAKDVSLKGYTDETLLNEVDGMTDILYEKQGSYLQGQQDLAKALIEAGKITAAEAEYFSKISAKRKQKK